jgi:hypothetical protein
MGSKTQRKTGRGIHNMKWKQFFLIWVIVFLLAPSIGLHRYLMAWTPPPGSDIAPPPLLVPFGWLYFGREFAEQLAGGDLVDALVIFLVIILPIILYTFCLSWIIYFIVQGIRRKRESRGEAA